MGTQMYRSVTQSRQAGDDVRRPLYWTLGIATGIVVLVAMSWLLV